MAKISRDRKTPRVKDAEEIRRVRGRFAEALGAGYTHEEAAKFAHGEGALPAREQAEAASAAETSEETKTSTVSLSGGGKEEKGEDSVSTGEIPPNWQDLPWPALKELAENVSNGSITSRKAANEAIEKALAARI